MPVLVRLADDGSPRVQDVLSLPGEDNLIGRGVGVHVSLVDETVSRMHARVFFDSGRWVLATLSAANPARVRGAAITSVVLEPGTIFELGRIRLRFEMQDPRRRPTMQLEERAEGLPERREPPAPTPNFDMVLTPELPERVEPEAARGSWQAAPPLSIPAPDAARARVEAMGLEVLAPPVDYRRGGVQVMQTPDYPRDSSSPTSQRRWPWVLLGMALSMGVMGIVLRERIAQTIARHSDPPALAVGPSKQEVNAEGNTRSKEVIAAPREAAASPARPKPASAEEKVGDGEGKVGDRRQEPLEGADTCSTRSQVELDAITGTALAQELKRRGPPNAVVVTRAQDGELRWELSYAAVAQRVTVTANSQVRSVALKPDATRPTALISKDEWAVAVAGLTDPPCLSEKFGMQPDQAVEPRAGRWQSARATLVIGGGQVRSFELRGLPAGAAIAADEKHPAPGESVAPSSATDE